MGTDAPFCVCDESTSSLPTQLMLGARAGIGALAAATAPDPAIDQARSRQARRNRVEVRITVEKLCFECRVIEISAWIGTLSFWAAIGISAPAPVLKGILHCSKTLR